MEKKCPQCKTVNEIGDENLGDFQPCKECGWEIDCSTDQEVAMMGTIVLISNSDDSAHEMLRSIQNLLKGWDH